MSITTLGQSEPETALQAPFPDPPRHPDEATNFRHLAKTGSAHYLAVHFGEPDTTVIDGKLYVSPDLVSNIKGLRAPDMQGIAESGIKG